MNKFEEMFKVMGEWAKDNDVAFIGSTEKRITRKVSNEMYLNKIIK